jgi:hypothetical protein
MFWPKGGCMAYCSTNIPSLLIIFPSFFHTFHTRFELPHPSITSILRCVCTPLPQDVGFHMEW